MISPNENISNEAVFRAATTTADDIYADETATAGQQRTSDADDGRPSGEINVGSTERTISATAGALLAGCAVALVALPAWRPERLNIGLFWDEGVAPFTFDGPDAFFAQHGRGGQAVAVAPMRWIFSDDDPTSSVTVTEYVTPDGEPALGLRNSGRPEGGTRGSDTTMRLIAVLPALFARLYPAMDALGGGYEVIFVNDGSVDRSAAMLREQFQKRPDVTRVILFNGNFGQHIVETA